MSFFMLTAIVLLSASVGALVALLMCQCKRCSGAAPGTAEPLSGGGPGEEDPTPKP